jgi:hypothetical protein
MLEEENQSSLKHNAVTVTAKPLLCLSMSRLSLRPETHPVARQTTGTSDLRACKFANKNNRSIIFTLGCIVCLSLNTP